ncbi:hypothetical protein, variant [Aphanomyces invadans]|uniref:YHYH domain-containing protein n=1 Tax=Aphanomyces invadans TaxID=157072 RepID=A0A024TSC5_9STRA|nr:hypothetical protein, variant [Aphanomyces invadans]ETV96257.1 hypothetical protein, variant [Aphanomyces invadans]|eukprot:XP_008875049.1 hypothetical protein, variant [Aphanomyces invadans]
MPRAWHALVMMLPVVAGDLAIPRSNVVNSIGSVDTLQTIPLVADIVIPDGREIFLPIHIPSVAVAVNANGPAKIDKVSSLHANGLFGVGEVIDIDVRFTSAVDVVGTPSLRMRTGCNTASCRVKEIQTITCSATSGKFAVSFQGQTVSNIPFNATPLRLTNYLLRLTSIAAVQVSYDAGTQACTFYGTKITIQFDQVNFVTPNTDDGNLPSLTTDRFNLQGDGIALAHHTRSVDLTPVAIEVQRGVAPTDRDALFVGMRTPTTLIFRYIVAYGDVSLDLDYAAPDSLSLNAGGSICNAGTLIAASRTLPVPGRAPAWPAGMVSSLAVNNDIALNSNIPVITAVTTTKPDGIYGQGEVIEIRIAFSLPVTVVGAPVLLLATGMNVARAPVVRVDAGGTVLVAQYIVSFGDYSLDLTYVDATSFVLNAGDAVLRQSTTSTMPVNMTLPPNGLPGSLFNLANIVIDTTPPYIMSVTSALPNGVYTTGDVLSFAMVFSRPVFVTGMPQFQVATGSTNLCPGQFVVRVPTDGDAKVFMFPEAVDWRWLEPGYFVVIGGRTYTVAGIVGYKVTMIESYVGTAVNLGTDPASPQLSIFTRGFQYATYTGGSTTSTLQFSYQVQHGDVSPDLTVASDVLLPPGSSILRLSTTPSTPANLAMPATGSAGSLAVASQLVINTDPTTVTSISSPTRSGVYVTNSIVAMAVQFSNPVVVVGPTAPGLLTNVGENRFATYVSGSGTNTLLFQLVILSSDSAAAVAPLSRDAIRMPNVFTSIRRKSMNPMDSAILTLPAAALTLASTVLTVNPSAATVTGLALEAPLWTTTTMALRPGDTATIAMTFSEPVAVAGGTVPLLDLTVGKPATYTSGTGTVKLLFQYTVQYGDQVASFDIASPDALRLNGATIVAVNGGAPASAQLFRLSLVMSNNQPPRQPLAIDPSPFRILNVRSWTIDGTYTVGDSLLLAVTLSDTVVVSGTPQLLLRTGNTGGDQAASYYSADANVLYFVYTVQPGDAIVQVVEASSAALQCWNDVGLNANPTADDASAVAVVDWSNQLVVCWSERGNVQVRLFNNNPNMPLWTTLSAALNANAAQAASNCKCRGTSTVPSQLVCAWEESTAGGSSVVHVSVMTGSVVSPVWTLLSGAGLNVDLTKAATQVTLASANSGVLVGWTEVMAATANSAIQIKSWNGNAGAPVWTSIDVASLMTTPPTSNHYHPRLFYFNARLTLAWTEAVSPTRTKIRIAAMVATSWVAMDGNGAGLNVPTRLASMPARSVCDSKLYVAWQATDTSGSNVGGTIRVQVYNSDGNTWTFIDGGVGLQSHPTAAIGVGFVSLACASTGLTAAWQEEIGGVVINRAATYSTAANAWSPAGTPMDNPSQPATSTGPVLAMSSAFLFAAWTERHAVNGKAQLHVAMFASDSLAWLSMTYGCLKRPGTGFSVPYALTLPSLFSQASLGDSARLELATSVPTVVDITALSPPGLYRLKDTVQTIAVVATGTSTITGGGYSIGYNGVASACVPWNAAAIDVENAIKAIPGLGLDVAATKVATAFLRGGVLFQITFATPSVGIHPLSVESNGCAPLTCANGAVCGRVLVNTDKPVSGVQPGYVDFLVTFSVPVQVAPGGVPPVLTLSNGLAATYTPGSIVQVLDVGVAAPSRTIAGSFALAYGGVPTACINVEATVDGSYSSVRHRLMELPAVANIGIASIRSRVFQNGIRHVIRFQQGAPLALSYERTITCTPLVGLVQTIDLTTSATVTAGSFAVGLGSLTSATCLPVLTTTAADLGAALVDLTNHEIMVTVQKQPLPTGGFRFAVTYPDAHAAEAMPLTVSTAGCTALVCAGGTCSLVVNADYTVAAARTPSLTFRYTIQAGDVVPALGYTSLTGSIQRAAASGTVAATLTLPQGLRPSGVQIDSTSMPTVTRVVSSTPNGVYSQGNRIHVVVSFNKAVDVTGHPTLELSSNGVAVYTSGSGTNAITFQYVVGPGEVTARLDCYSTASLQFLTPATAMHYRDPITQALTPVDPTLPVGADANSLATLSAVVIDAVVPSVVAVTSLKASGTYGTDESIDFVVEFTHPVVVTGTPSIALNSGGSALYTLGGLRQLLDVGVTSPVTSGQFAVWYDGVLSECIVYNDVDMLRSKLLDLPGIGAIGLTSVTSAPYGLGHRITVLFATPDVHTAPLELVPATPRHCIPLSPPSSNTFLVTRGSDDHLTFRYTVQNTDAATALAVIGPTIALHGGTMRRQSDNPSMDVATALVLPATMHAIRIQGGVPSIAHVTMVTAGGTYGVGYPPASSPPHVKPGQILFTVAFSIEVVFVDDVTIVMNTGRSAVLYAQVSPTEYSFVYTVEVGDASANFDFASPNAMVGTIVGRSTTNRQPVNKVLPFLQLTGANVVSIDPTLPAAIVAVTTTHPDGTVGAGEVISVQTTFGRPTTVLSGLNHNPVMSAKFPAMTEANGVVYVSWSEETSDTTSVVYVGQLDPIAGFQELSPPGGMNFHGPNSKAVKSCVVVHDGQLYVAWDESGIVNIARFSGNMATKAWTPVPFMGSNANLAATASTPQLITYMNTLFIVWMEFRIPHTNTEDSFSIRAASYDASVAPPWNVYDTAQGTYGLNKDRATDPHAIVFAGHLYVAWAEFTGSRFAIQIAAFLLNTMTFAKIPQVGYVSDAFVTAFGPILYANGANNQLMVRWYTFPAASVEPTMHTGIVMPQYWKELVMPLPTLGYAPHVMACQGQTIVAYTVQTAGSLKLVAGAVDSTGALSKAQTLNHNLQQDAMSPKLACLAGGVALAWTEYDGVSYKMRVRLKSAANDEWKESVAGLATLVLTNGLVAVNTDLSGTCTVTHTFVLRVAPNTPAIARLNAASVASNRARIQDCLTFQLANTILFPLASDRRSLAYATNIAVDTSPPVVVDVSTTLSSGTYGAGQLVPVLVRFSTPVVVSPWLPDGNSPAWIVFQSRVAALDGSHEHKAVLSAGNGTDTLTFLYTTLDTDKFLLFDYMLPTSLGVDPMAGWIRRKATVPTTDAVLTLPTPGLGHSLSRWFIAVDTAPPTILDVSASNADGTYYPGDVIHIVVTFSLPVMVWTADSPPQLALATQPLTNPSLRSYATYVGGSGSTRLTFDYQVQPFDQTTQLQLFDDRSTDVGSFVMAVEASANSIFRLASFPTTLAILACPAPGTLSSMNQRIALDSTVPTITGMSTTLADGTYDIDTVIPIRVAFSAPVAVTGMPLLLLNVYKDATRGAVYASGSGTNVIVFVYRIQLGDDAWPLDHLNTNAMQLKMPLRVNPLQDPPFPTIHRMSSNPTLPANLTLPPLGPAPQINTPPNLIRAGHVINVRTDGVRVSQVESSAPKTRVTYAAGHVVELFVHFTQLVYVMGTPQLMLNVPTRATYVSGSSTEVLRFVYTVAPGDTAAGLEITSVLLGAGVTIQDAVGIPVPLQVPSVGSQHSLGVRYKITIAGIPPVVVGVAAPTSLGNAVLAAGDVVQFTVMFSMPVVVQGAAPQMALNVGQSAVYVSGSGTSSLLFVYTIRAGDAGTLDYASAAALSGTIRALSTTPTTLATLTLPLPGAAKSLSASSSIRVNTVAPTVVNVTFAGLQDQVCTVGMDIPIQIAFSYPVAVVPSPEMPTLALATKGNMNQVARYVGGTGTSLLHFIYTVQAGDASTALEYTHANALRGTILQFSSSPTVSASLTLPVPGSTGSLSGNARLSVCMSCARVLSVTGSPSGVYTVGDALSMVVTFSEAVRFDRPTAIPPPTMYIRLAMALERVASYVSGSGTAVWVFSYQVQPNDDVYPFEVANTLAMYGAKVVSVARPTYLASLRLPQPGRPFNFSASSSVRIDTTPPKIVQVTTPIPDGTYGPGHAIPIDVVFSVPVVVAGAPVLRLAVLPTPQLATYNAPGSTPSVLRFVYVVQPGDMIFRLDYMRVCSDRGFFDDVEGYDPVESELPCLPIGTVSALDLHGGSIKAAAGTPTVDANLELPAVSPWPAMRYLRSDYSVVYGKNLTERRPNPAEVGSVCLFGQEDEQFHLLANGIPNHAATSELAATAYMIELPRFPTPNWSRERPFGLVGVMLNGVPFNNSADLAPQSADSCGGAVDAATKRYTYVGVPTCFLETAMARSTMVGYVLDGYPLHVLPTTRVALDECNGELGPDGVYRYYLNPHTIESTGTFVPCFKGVVSVRQQQAIVVDYQFVGGIEGFSSAPMRLQELVVVPHGRDSIWLNADSVSISTTASTLIVASSGIPDGPVGPFPNAFNPNSILPQNYQFRIPRSPVPSATRHPLASGAVVGVMLNGIPMYNTIDTDGNSLLDPRIVRHLILDKCNGYVDATGAYRYYAPPDCLLEALGEVAGQPSPLIGYALDGYPIYGRYDASGRVPTNLDACNGRVNEMGSYQYHVTDLPPYTIGCFYGVALQSALPFYQSLAVSSAIAIDSTAPYITDITTLKNPGTYTAGETIDFRVLWSNPIVVTGTPTLTLAVVNNTTRVAAVATYSAATSTSTTSVFLYVVGPEEYVDDLAVRSPTALELPAGSSIKRAATTPMLNAILTCPVATLGARIQAVANVQVNLRGLYHPDAQDLTVYLMHNDIRARLFDPIPMSGYHFGRPRDNTALHVDIEDSVSGIGGDYSFVASNLGVNLALSGIATQSTSFGPTSLANKAIDGIRSAYFSSQSIARTSGCAQRDPSPWWQLRLDEPVAIGTIKIFNVAQQRSQFEVQVVTVTGPIPVEGTFQLRVGGTCTTPPVSVDAVAMRRDERIFGDSFQAKLEACTGQVTVLRSAADRMGGYGMRLEGESPLSVRVGIRGQ